MKTNPPKLKRVINPMPTFVREALNKNGLMARYKSRPPYQRNDYLGWISRAKKPETQQRRLAQMLAELARGDLYMKIKYNPKS